MKNVVAKLNSISRSMTDEEQAAIANREENAAWWRKSAIIALRIKKILRLNNISQAEFASLMKVSPAQVSKWLSGETNFELKTICKIEGVLGEEILTVVPTLKENKKEIEQQLRAQKAQYVCVLGLETFNTSKNTEISFCNKKSVQWEKAFITGSQGLS